MVCPHRPACPTGTTQWVCGQRTRLEDGVNRGLIKREMAQRLLTKYRVPMTPPSKVFRGESKPSVLQSEFFEREP